MNICYRLRNADLSSRRKILAVSTQLKQLRKESMKKFRLEPDSNSWPLRCRCSALPTELSSRLGAGYIFVIFKGILRRKSIRREYTVLADANIALKVNYSISGHSRQHFKCFALIFSWSALFSPAPAPARSGNFFGTVLLPYYYLTIIKQQKCAKRNYRCEQDSNLRGETPLDFESNALTTRPSQRQIGIESKKIIKI